MDKILKKYTTIPDHLYVNRVADKQLASIINEMERPGYVLVARQMGKTNLLFNAKRRLENENRLFVYVDLSNSYSKEQECYRNIIDCIIEPNEEIFSTIKQDVYRLRNENTQPHNEYNRSLRSILKVFKGNIIIILDEIDALKGTTYSDNIFAQIRSNYFARTNFPEFNRLTYVLSGVIEPSDLIKDKNKSPFNIGEKIYLDDFNYEEHDEFIKKSKLNISLELSNDIYKWTNGNPRLTFDICSDLENLLLDSKTITRETIEEVIAFKYLTTYDIPPIDHIRELIKKDRVVRQAIMNIQRGADTVSDEIKKKLYLYGIISSEFSKKPLIKNRILKKALSMDWLESVNAQTQDLFLDGVGKMNQKDYYGALHDFNNYLSNSNYNSQSEEICKYYIGYCYYALKKFNDAIAFFKNDFNTSDLEGNSKSFLGVCFIAIGETDKGVRLLEGFIDLPTNKISYHNALLNLIYHYIKNNIEYEKVLELSDKLLHSLDESSDDVFLKWNSSKNKLRTLALYYKSEVLIKLNHKDSALEAIVEAKKYAELIDMPELIYYELIIKEVKDLPLLSNLVDTIIDNNLTFDFSNDYQISYVEKNHISYLILLYCQEDKNLFEKLINYTINDLYLNKKTRFHIYLIMAKSLQSPANLQYDFLSTIIKNKQHIADIGLILESYCYYLLLDNIENEELYFDDYYILIKKNHNDLSNEDTIVFIKYISFYTSKEKYSLALNLCEFLENKIIELPEKPKMEFGLIYYWKANILKLTNKGNLATFYANKALSVLNKSNAVNVNLLNASGLRQVKGEMQSIINSTFYNTVFTEGENNTDTRNSFKDYQEKTNVPKRSNIIKVKYLQGNDSVKVGKYKMFEKDIKSGKCKIIS